MDMPAICVTVEVRPLHAVLQAAIGCGSDAENQSLFSWHGLSRRNQACTRSALHVTQSTMHHTLH